MKHLSRHRRASSFDFALRRGRRATLLRTPLRMTQHYLLYLLYLPHLLYPHIPRALAQSATVGPKPLKLLEPLPDGTASLTVCAKNSFFLLNQYLQPMMTWGIGIAAGLAVLMIVIGGLQMMFSGGVQAGMEDGKKRMLSAIFGLIFLVFSAGFLNLLNAYFYQLGGVGAASCPP